VREQAVIALKVGELGALPLIEEPLQTALNDAISSAMITGIRTLGLSALPWTTAARSLQTRIAFLRSVLPPEESVAWPDLSDEHLTTTLEAWLQPFLDGITRRDHLTQLDMTMILGQCVPYALMQTLPQLAPTHLLVPSGSTVPIDYDKDPPRVSVRLQEVFGLLKTPRVANQRVALAIELLSPARRPVQITRDLESFWSKGYEEVRKELKGRYPKHFWPDDPRHAAATARAKPRT
jgi:ATP-dependent helicase HrpB